MGSAWRADDAEYGKCATAASDPRIRLLGSLVQLNRKSRHRHEASGNTVLAEPDVVA